ncbi:MAG: hypothetical protein IJ833_04305 [Lachnospiraceae bacterium]|nr:hypothetical protein [Lachnospiraceae bacterium]
MAEFKELIKNFNKCRDYVRDFFVYGFKSRQDFTSDRKSARTYDDERRRITSWLSEYVVEDMAETADTPKNHVKTISLQIDSNLLDTNPLFSVWKTKSFTDNDILLHFYLFDLLNDPPVHTSYTANELADLLSANYAFPADTQLVRRKCNEYVKEGLLEAEKDGKTLRYRRGLTWDALFASDPASSKERIPRQNMWETSMIHAISFFQLDIPFGYIGNTILERISKSNNVFRIKHSFPAFTLEEEIAYQLLTAKKEHSYVKMDIMSNKTGQTPRPLYGVPLKIFVSARTGRRYICVYHMIQERAHTVAGNRRKTSVTSKKEPKYHFRCVRLDQIKSVSVLTPDSVSGAKRTAIAATTDAFAAQEEALIKNLPLVWGVSFEGIRTKVALTLKIDERYEGFILNRLEREGKHGTVTRLDDNTFLYEKVVFDAKEMFPWLRTFIGRIMDIHFMTMNQNFEEIRENTSLRQQFLEDLDALSKLYI